ncbi:MAG: heparinase II/III family protein [Pirellulales bacterium]|nr:heparinase II/III family protein [Pirellulales bacterium]
MQNLRPIVVLLAGMFSLATSALADQLPDPARVSELAGLLPASPRGVGRPIADRQAWEAVAAAPEFREVVSQAARLKDEPLPAAADELYLEFSRNGNRRRYERVQSERHTRFPALVVAECIDNQGRFLAAIEEAIREVCSEKAWVLPAHDSDLRNFSGREIDVDLRSSAAGWNLATAAYWLGDKLSPETRQRIHDELERRIFAPYESSLKTGKPRMWWITGTNNWNAVCHAGVAGAALAAVESPQRRALFAAAAEKNIDYFLQGFTSDGYCSEGMGYWNYGFGHYALLAETLHQATGGKLDLMKDTRVEPIARFGRRMEILPGIYPAFADCHVGARPDPELMAWLSRRFGWGLSQIEEENLLLAGGPTTSLFEFGLYRFPNSASQTPPAKPAAADRALREWFEEAGILICRPAAGIERGLGVALKGGHNAEHHNHNDVGSFLIALGSGVPLVDPGSEVYTARTFSGKRYQSNVLNSFGHPVPLVAGQQQRTGRQAAAKVLKTEFTDATDTIVLDLRQAYTVKELETLERTFVFSREGAGSLAVTDNVRFSSPQSFGTALIMFSEWKQARETRLLVGEGKDKVGVEITASGAKFKLTAEKIQEDLPGGRIPTRLGIDLSEPVREAAVTLTIRPSGTE